MYKKYKLYCFIVPSGQWTLSEKFRNALMSPCIDVSVHDFMIINEDSQPTGVPFIMLDYYGLELRYW